MTLTMNNHKGRTEVCSGYLGHHANILKIQQLQSQETWYIALGFGPIIVCSNDDPRLTVTYLSASSNSAAYAFEWENNSKAI